MLGVLSTAQMHGGQSHPGVEHAALRSYPYLMGKLVDLFGEGAEGLTFVMDHTWLCGGVMLAGGVATFCRFSAVLGSFAKLQVLWSPLNRTNEN